MITGTGMLFGLALILAQGPPPMQDYFEFSIQPAEPSAMQPVTAVMDLMQAVTCHSHNRHELTIDFEAFEIELDVIIDRHIPICPPAWSLGGGTYSLGLLPPGQYVLNSQVMEEWLIYPGDTVEHFLVHQSQVVFDVGEGSSGAFPVPAMNVWSVALLVLLILVLALRFRPAIS